MSLSKHFKDNPIATIGLILTLLGVGFSVVNFIILDRIQPLDSRVSAIEEDHMLLVDQHNSQQEVINEIPVIKSQLLEINKKIDRIEDKLDGLFIPR